MTLKDETDRIGHLIQALYPDLFPRDLAASRGHELYESAFDRSTQCRELGDALKLELEAELESRRARGYDNRRHPSDLFSEFSSSPRLWKKGLQLAEECMRCVKPTP